VSAASTATPGLWHFRASYQGGAYEHAFFVGDVIFANGYD